MIVCGVMYAYDCLTVFRAADASERRWKFGKELFFTFLMHFAGYAAIFVHQEMGTRLGSPGSSTYPGARSGAASST